MCCVGLCCIVSCHAVLCCVVLCCVMLCCVVVCCAVLCCVVRCGVVLCCVGCVCSLEAAAFLQAECLLERQESQLPVLASSALGLITGGREQPRPCFMDISAIKSEPAFVHPGAIDPICKPLAFSQNRE